MEARYNAGYGFIRQAAQKVFRSIEETDYSVTKLANELSLSREQTHRKLKKYTNLSTGQFIRFLRLLSSHKYLNEGTLTIAEISYKVGFDNPGYFNKCFSKEFGMPPGKVRRDEYDSRHMSVAMKAFFKIPIIREIIAEQGVPVQTPTSSQKRYNTWIITGILTLVVLIMVGVFLSLQNPEKKLQLKAMETGRIGILPLTNRTGEVQYDQVGEITSSWLSSKLDALDRIRTVPYFTIKQYEGYAGVLPDDPERRPTLGEVTGAGYVLIGSYFKQSDQLMFDVRLVDAHTQETAYHLPTVSGSLDSIMYTVEQLRLELAGLLLNLEKVKLGRLNPPNYHAYTNYVKGIHALRDGTYPKRAYDYFSKATQMDNNFVMAQIFVSWFTPPEKRDSLFKVISSIQMTKYERKVFEELHYTHSRDYHKALSTTLDNLRENPNDYYLNMEAAHLAKSLYFPKLALRILRELEDPLLDDVGVVWNYYKTWNYAESLAMLNEHDSVIRYINNMPQEFHSPATPLILIRSMINQHADRVAIEKVVQTYSEDSLLAENYCAAAYEYKLMGNLNNAQYFAAKAIPLMQKLPQTKAHLFDLTDAFYLNNNLYEARSHIRHKLSGDPDNTEFRIYLAQIEAAMGMEAEAYQAISGLLDRDTAVYWRRHEYEHHSDYLMARISALLGKKEESIALIERALQNGQLCHTWDFEHDIFLFNILEEPAFKVLIAPRRYPGEINLP